MYFILHSGPNQDHPGGFSEMLSPDYFRTWGIRVKASEFERVLTAGKFALEERTWLPR